MIILPIGKPTKLYVFHRPQRKTAPAMTAPEHKTIVSRLEIIELMVTRGAGVWIPRSERVGCGLEFQVRIVAKSPFEK